MNIHLTLKSSNKKTGPIPVSTTSADTCPDACPFRGSGCYAESGPLALHWGKVSRGERGMSWTDFCSAVAAFAADTLWRHNQAGDLPHVGQKIDWPKLRQLTEANHGKRGFTYTHHDMDIAANVAAVREANDGGFTINVSANSPTHADELAGLGLPLVTVLPADVGGAKTPVVYTPMGRAISVCPATYRDDVSCATCQLCQRQNRKTIVGFPAHGPGAKKASTVARGA